MRSSCDQCEYKGTKKENLKTHINSVHGDVWSSCGHCDYKVAKEGILKTHIDCSILSGTSGNVNDATGARVFQI